MRTFLSALALTLVLAGCGQSGQPGHDAGQQAGSQTAQTGADSSKAAAGAFESVAAKRSYALGMNIGRSVKKAPVELSMSHLVQGIKDVVKGGNPKLSAKELRATLRALATEMQAARRQQKMAQAKANAKAGKAFRAQYRQKEGVKVTESGLMYKVLEKGEGESPDANDRVKVHYVGTLIDGTVFDSSHKRGKPVVFPVSAVIPGWTEALQLMHEGARYEIVVPPELAYGKRGAGSQIGPNETLIFRIKLIEVMANDKKASDGDSTGAANADSGSAQ